MSIRCGRFMGAAPWGTPLKDRSDRRLYAERERGRDVRVERWNEFDSVVLKYGTGIPRVLSM